MLISRFKYCSLLVKCVLFRTYCLCLYNISLWKNFTVTCINRMKSCYHKCNKKFLALLEWTAWLRFRLCCAYQALILHVLHNAKSSLHKQCHNTSNCLIHYLLRLFDVCDVWLLNGWMERWIDGWILVFLSLCFCLCFCMGVCVCVCVIMPVCPSLMVSYSCIFRRFRC